MNKIISYNVNGLRAAVQKGFLDWFSSERPYILCIQEIKLQADSRPQLFFEPLGYHSFFHYAEKKGYSGVGLVSAQMPDFVNYGIGDLRFDSEGRLVRADFGDITYISVYIPSGTMGDLRQQIKMESLDVFSQYIKQLRMERPKLVISGDFNICHKPIDINHPERHLNSSGFLPEERAWMDSFVDLGFVDTFRQFNSSPNQYSWWSYRAGARAKNLGWRIDYHFVSDNLSPSLSNADIRPDVVHSDHCPVTVNLEV